MDVLNTSRPNNKNEYLTILPQRSGISHNPSLSTFSSSAWSGFPFQPKPSLSTIVTPNLCHTHTFSGCSMNVPPLGKPGSYPKWLFSSSSLPLFSACVSFLNDCYAKSLSSLDRGFQRQDIPLSSLSSSSHRDSMLPIVGYQQMPAQNTDYRRNEHAASCMQWL